MSIINASLSWLFNLLMRPFESIDPWYALLVFSLAASLIALVIVRETSNQDGIRRVKNQIKAHILEFRLFKDDLWILISAFKLVMTHNLRYLSYTARPLLWLFVPFLIVLIQLDGWLGYRPLAVGEAAVVSVTLADHLKDGGLLSKLSIEASEGLAIETPALRIPENQEVDWRVRARAAGRHNLSFQLSGETARKEIVVEDDAFRRVSPRLVFAGLLEKLINPGESPRAASQVFERIEVQYPARLIPLAGWEVHWLIPFFLLSVIFGFAFKGFLKVEL